VEIGKLLFNISAMAVDSSPQRISRLTPLEAVLASVARIEPVPSRACSLSSAQGRVLAADVTAAKLPPQPVALRDGFAVAASAVADASSYAPIPLMPAPPRVDAGASMPSGTDAVLPLDAVAFHGERAEAIAAIAPGEGVLAAGGDASPQTVLRRAGAYLRASDIAVMMAAGIADVAVREPRIRIACGGAAKTPLVQAGVDMLTRAVTAAGGTVFETESTPARRCRPAPTRCCRSMPSRFTATAPTRWRRSRRARACWPRAATPRRRRFCAAPAPLCARAILPS